MTNELDDLVRKVEQQGQKVRQLEEQRHQITEQLGKEAATLYRLTHELKGKQQK